MSNIVIDDLFKIVLAASKDKAYKDATEKMQAAFHELILTEAASRREKTKTLIQSMAKIDAEIIRFKREYARISDQFSPEAKDAIENILRIAENKKKDLIAEKNSLKFKR